MLKYCAFKQYGFDEGIRAYSPYNCNVIGNEQIKRLQLVSNRIN